MIESQSTSEILSGAKIANETKHNFKTKIGREYSAKGIKVDVFNDKTIY